jgi:hypothetical protein
MWASGSAATKTNAPRFSAPVQGQEACHTVIRQMHAIGAFVDADGCRRAGARLGYLLDRLFRNRRITNNREGKLATEVWWFLETGIAARESNQS